VEIRLQALRDADTSRPVLASTRPDASPPSIGDVRLVCPDCSTVVARNPPLGRVLSMVFRCPSCGATGEVPRPRLTRLS
jgi:predicted RNA-binding Zn-ribbon protein involved in translation (DUF1610 family)